VVSGPGLENPVNLLRLYGRSFRNRRAAAMDVAVKLEDQSKHTWAVYVDGVCIARGLPRAEANRVRAEVEKRKLNIYPSKLG
jgi:hypothetical protein